MNVVKCSLWVGLAVAACLCQFPLQGASITLHATADTTLQQATPDSNFGDGTSFTAGGRLRGGATRALMKFDIANSVPAGATINSVSLTLNVVAAHSGAVNSIFDLHRVSVSWGEGGGSDHGGSPGGPSETTWNSRFASATSWTAPGGDFAGAISAGRSIAGVGTYTFASTGNLISDVQGWLDTPGNNNGWIMLSESENTPITIRRFASRDAGATGPTLAINFTPVPEPGTWALFGMGAFFIAWRLRRRANALH